MWFRVELAKDGSITKIDEVDGAFKNSHRVMYVEANSKTSAAQLAKRAYQAYLNTLNKGSRPLSQRKWTARRDAIVKELEDDRRRLQRRAKKRPVASPRPLNESPQLILLRAALEAYDRGDRQWFLSEIERIERLSLRRVA